MSKKNFSKDHKFLQVQRTPPIKRYDETHADETRSDEDIPRKKEDQEFPLLLRMTSLELPASKITNYHTSD